MLKVDERIACTEALKVYNLLDRAEKEKIPQKFISYLKSHYSDDVLVKIQACIPLDMQPISKEGWNLIRKMAQFI